MEQEKTQIQKVAERLAAIHSETFGGKIVGRYRISRAKLLQLLNINMLRDKVIKELEEELFELGFSLMYMDTHFCILEVSVTANWRNVTKKIINEYTR
jgi:hypothetical protein